MTFYMKFIKNSIRYQNVNLIYLRQQSYVISWQAKFPQYLENQRSGIGGKIFSL
jgi:hypothetical protein